MRNKTGCMLCGGPCTTPCTDNAGGRYLGCDHGCRFKTLEEIEAMAGPKASPTADDVRARVAAMSDEDVVRLWDKLKAL